MSRLSQSKRTKSCRLLKILGRGRFHKRHSEERWLKDNYSLIRMVILTLLQVVSNFPQIKNPKWEVNWCKRSKMCMDCKTQSKEIDNNSSKQLSYPRMAPLTLITQESNHHTVFLQWMNRLYSILGFSRIYPILKETKKRKSVSLGDQEPHLFNRWLKVWVLFRTH